MKRVVTIALLLLAAFPLDADPARALPPECRLATGPRLRDAGTRTRALLHGLVPSLYVRWEGRLVASFHRDGHLSDGNRPADATRRDRTFRGSWEIGLRWRPLDILRDHPDRDLDRDEREFLPVDPEICRELSRVRRRAASAREPRFRTLLEQEILERRIEAAAHE